MPFYTTEIARECNISLNTARNWAREYKEVLSPGASVEGEQRVFDDRDREVFKLITQLRAEKLRRDEIIERVRQTNFAEIEETGRQADQPTALAVSPNELSQTPDAALIAAMFDAHTRRLEALEQARTVPVANHSRMSDIVLGVLLALGFMVVILLLALIYGVK